MLMVAALLLCVEPAGAAPDLLARMAAVNPSLRSYTATLHAEIHLLTFPFLSTDIVGTLYRKEPDREKLVVTSGLPFVAQNFGKLYPNIVSPSRWEQMFVVTQAGDDGGITRLRLVPRKRGNVDHIDVSVDDATALVTSLRWNYRNGGYALMKQRFAPIQGEELAIAEQGHIQEPGYVADITATLDGYHVNVPLSESIFEQP
jgi:hypothetical protein